MLHRHDYDSSINSGALVVSRAFSRYGVCAALLCRNVFFFVYAPFAACVALLMIARRLRTRVVRLFRPCGRLLVVPGKLSYTYWRGFEKYDQAWGLTDKYNETLSKLSKEALELDRQYKIRAKALRYTAWAICDAMSDLLCRCRAILVYGHY